MKKGILIIVGLFALVLYALTLRTPDEPFGQPQALFDEKCNELVRDLERLPDTMRVTADREHGRVLVGPAFSHLSFQDQETLARGLGCTFEPRNPSGAIFEIIDANSGKRLGRFSHGTLKID